MQGIPSFTGGEREEMDEGEVQYSQLWKMGQAGCKTDAYTDLLAYTL